MRGGKLSGGGFAAALFPNTIFVPVSRVSGFANGEFRCGSKVIALFVSGREFVSKSENMVPLERPGEVEVLLGRFTGLSFANNDAVGGLSFEALVQANDNLQA